MFTGIVECIGTIASLSPLPTGTTLTISTPAFLLSDAHLGDSISINGTCLTITSFTPAPSASASSTSDSLPTQAPAQNHISSTSTSTEHDSAATATFTVGVSPETLRRTNLGRLAPRSPVNLERAVSAHTRMGGHFVQGHVDTVATIVDVRVDGEAKVLRLRPRERDVLRYVVEKGYVTLDGASLTVTAVSDGGGRAETKEMEGDGKEEDEGREGNGWWEVMLIAYTQEKIVTAGKGVGDEVNVEVDMVGKYVEKSVRGYLDGLIVDKEGGKDEGGGGGGMLEKMVGRIVEEKMMERERKR